MSYTLMIYPYCLLLYSLKSSSCCYLKSTKIHIAHKNVSMLLSACIYMFVLVVGSLALWMTSCCKNHLCIYIFLMLWSVLISVLARSVAGIKMF